MAKNKIQRIDQEIAKDVYKRQERHEPLIDSKSFAIVQDKLKSRQRPVSYTHLFVG